MLECLFCFSVISGIYHRILESVIIEEGWLMLPGREQSASSMSSGFGGFLLLLGPLYSPLSLSFNLPLFLIRANTYAHYPSLQGKTLLKNSHISVETWERKRDNCFSYDKYSIIIMHLKNVQINLILTTFLTWISQNSCFLQSVILDTTHTHMRTLPSCSLLIILPVYCTFFTQWSTSFSVLWKYNFISCNKFIIYHELLIWWY